MTAALLQDNNKDSNMKILRIDPFHGASGDMLLAAMLDAGVPEDVIFKPLYELLPEEFKVSSKKVKRHNLSATELTIKERSNPGGRFRNLHDLLSIIEKSDISERGKNNARRCISNLAKAEARIHCIPAEEVHFHEIGAIDTIIDTIGFMAALDYLSVEEIYVSPTAVGSGVVRTEHGEMPLPVPAVMELLKGFTVRHCNEIEGMELCTPTGAMLLAGLGRPLSEMPLARPVVSGYGAGRNDPPGFSNCLRLTLMEVQPVSMNMEEMIQAETVIDDQTPEQISWAAEQIRKAGAVETAITTVALKKGRTGFLLSILLDKALSDQVFNTLFKETTTLGVRYFPVKRRTLERRFVRRDTRWGKVTVKQGILDDHVLTSSPEYEDCAEIASRERVPLKDVFKEANRDG